MTDTSTQSLALYYPGVVDLSVKKQFAWEQFFEEARFVVKGLDLSLLRDWARRSLAIAVRSTVYRAAALRGLLRAVVKGAWKEFKRFFSALVSFKMSDYFKDVCRRLWSSLKATWQQIKAAVSGVKSFVTALPGASRDELIDYTVSFFGAVMGFVLIGGTGDGGVIDLDIAAFGIGGHRSIWFHSALVGLAAEICFLSFFELVKLLHERLPRQHSPVWDRMLGVGNRFTHALVVGSWAGVATHLAVDSRIDGWTPYKHLPIGLPEWGHHMIMDMNAAAAGWFGWQWHDKAKRHLRDNRIVPARYAGRDLAPLGRNDGIER